MFSFLLYEDEDSHRIKEVDNHLLCYTFFFFFIFININIIYLLLFVNIKNYINKNIFFSIFIKEK